MTTLSPWGNSTTPTPQLKLYGTRTRRFARLRCVREEHDEFRNVQCQRDLLATTGDYLRLWEVQGDGDSFKMVHLFNTVCLLRAQALVPSSFPYLCCAAEQELGVLCTAYVV